MNGYRALMHLNRYGSVPASAEQSKQFLQTTNWTLGSLKSVSWNIHIYFFKFCHRDLLSITEKQITGGIMRWWQISLFIVIQGTSVKHCHRSRQWHY